MKSSRTLIAALAGVVASMGCVPDRSSIEFAGVFEPMYSGDDCAYSGPSSAALLAGSMNTAITIGYLLDLKLNNTLPATNVTVGGTEISPKTRNDFVIREAEFSYECKDTKENCAGFNAPKPTIIQMAGFVPANSTSTLGGLSVMTPEAGIAIADWSVDVPAIILVKMKFRGDYVSGATHETDTIAFPVTVYKKGAGLLPCPVDTQAKFPECNKTPPPTFGMNGLDYYTCEPITAPTK
ncbi:MAG TPA: hypothetical protein VGK67_22850 [Myxococcales bacterium]|jgi:hypothetical protein